jgi:hypothetical protein
MLGVAKQFRTPVPYCAPSNYCGETLSMIQTVYADFAAVRAVGRSLVPVEGAVPPVRMAKESVDVHLYPWTAIVEASFEFESLSDEDVEIEVGFPCFGLQDWSPIGSVDPCLAFEVFADGLPVETHSQRIDNSKFPMWFVWTQKFPARATTRLKAQYQTLLEHYSLASRIPFTYVLRTGNYWSGNIGEAIVRVHARCIPLWAIREASPPGFEVDVANNMIAWTFRDFAPKMDIGLLISSQAVQYAFDGIALHSLRAICEDRPPAGTEVWVAGPEANANNLAELGTEFVLQSERMRDQNIMVPDGLRRFQDDAPQIRVERGNLRVETFRSNGPLFLGKGMHLVVFGVIEYSGGRLFVRARRILESERTQLRTEPDSTPGLLRSKSAIEFPKERPSSRFTNCLKVSDLRIAAHKWRIDSFPQRTEWSGASLRSRVWDGGWSDVDDRVTHDALSFGKDVPIPEFELLRRTPPRMTHDQPFMSLARVSGSSGVPLVEHGDVVLLRRAIRIAPGDVVAYDAQGRPTLAKVGSVGRWLDGVEYAVDLWHERTFPTSTVFGKWLVKLPRWLSRRLADSDLGGIDDRNSGG